MPGPSLVAPEAVAQALAACVAAFTVAGEAPAHRVVAHARAESGLERFAVGVNEDRSRGLPREARVFSSGAEATAFAFRKLRAEGRRIDVGVMQVNDANWGRLGLDWSNLFEIPANVCAGARILGEAYAAEINRRAACAYNTGRPDCRSRAGTNGYPERVERAAGAAARRTARVAVAEPADPAPETASWDTWAVPLPEPDAGPATPEDDGTDAPASGGTERVIAERE